MAIRSIIEELFTSIKEKNEEAINSAEKDLIEKITETANEQTFYSLPIDQISNIIRKVDFTNKDIVKEPITLLQTIIQKTTEVHEKDAVLILNDIRVEKFPQISTDNIINIISKFTSSEILTKLWELYEEEKHSVTSDYEFTIDNL